MSERARAHARAAAQTVAKYVITSSQKVHAELEASGAAAAAAAAAAAPAWWRTRAALLQPAVHVHLDRQFYVE